MIDFQQLKLMFRAFSAILRLKLGAEHISPENLNLWKPSQK